MHPCGHVWTALQVVLIGILSNFCVRDALLQTYRGHSLRNKRIRENVTHLQKAKEWIKRHAPSATCFCNDATGKQITDVFDADGNIEDPLDFQMICCAGCGIWFHSLCACTEEEQKIFWTDAGTRNPQSKGIQWFCDVCTNIPSKLIAKQKRLNAADRNEFDGDLVSQLSQQRDDNTKWDPFSDLR